MHGFANATKREGEKKMKGGEQSKLTKAVRSSRNSPLSAEKETQKNNECWLIN